MESLEIKAMDKNVQKSEQFFDGKYKKFNKSNFLFYTYCISMKKVYNN